MRERSLAYISALLCTVLALSACKGGDDKDNRLSKIRLFSVDSVADTIRELNAKTGGELNAFLAPGPGISGAGCGLAYDRDSGRLFFHDSIFGPTDIWSIDPDDPDPTGTAVLLPTPMPFPPYTALAHDGLNVLALRPGPDMIDWLHPVTGDYLFTRDYSAAADLEEGLDGSPTRLFATGTDGAGAWVINELDFSGGVLVQFSVNIPGFQPRALGFARGILYVADMGNSEIQVIDMDTGELLKVFPIQVSTSVCGLAAASK